MFRKYNISLLDGKWELIRPVLKVKQIPRYGEFIYLSDEEQYYKVLNVIHNITGKHEIFVVVEKYEK